MIQINVSVRALVFLLLLGVALFAGSDMARGAPSSADLTVDGNLVFTGPNQSGAKDIRTSVTDGGLRIYNGTSLSPIPSGAAIQFFGNGSASFPGQAFIDSGANTNGAIIFRTAGTGQGITERLRIDSSGNISATGNFSTTGIINIPHGIQTYDMPGISAFIVPAGVNKVLMQAWGAGGGGGACGPTCTVVGGGGGGGGAAAQVLFDVSPGDTFTFVVGAGGVSGIPSGTPATNGGSTTVTFGVTSVVAGGGLAGGNSESSVGTGGPGGIATIVPLGGNSMIANGAKGADGNALGLGGQSGASGIFRPFYTGLGGTGYVTALPTNGGNGLVVFQW